MNNVPKVTNCDHQKQLKPDNKSSLAAQSFWGNPASLILTVDILMRHFNKVAYVYLSFSFQKWAYKFSNITQ